MIDAVLEVRRGDLLPPKPTFDQPEDETKFYTRSAFSAWTRALEIGRHHAPLWKAIQGSPYEEEYRRRFLGRVS